MTKYSRVTILYNSQWVKEGMADPKEKVEKKTSQSSPEVSSMMFPTSLYADTDKSIVFSFFKYEKPDPLKKELKEPLGSIALPIPPELGQEDAMEYSDFEGGFIARSAGPVRDSVKSIYNRVMNDEKLDVGELISNSGSLLGQAGMSVAQQLLGDEFNYFRSVGGGATLNPHVGSIFEKVGLRTYQFSYAFKAMNQADSNAIRDIIYKFKYFEHPSTNGGTSFLYHPEIVTFSFTPEKVNNYLYKPNVCGIMGISVLYNGDSTPKFFEDTGAPVEVILSIQLKELTYETKESLAKAYGRSMRQSERNQQQGESAE